MKMIAEEMVRSDQILNNFEILKDALHSIANRLDMGCERKGELRRILSLPWTSRRMEKEESKYKEIKSLLFWRISGWVAREPKGQTDEGNAEKTEIELPVN